MRYQSTTVKLFVPLRLARPPVVLGQQGYLGNEFMESRPQNAAYVLHVHSHVDLRSGRHTDPARAKQRIRFGIVHENLKLHAHLSGTKPRTLIPQSPKIAGNCSESQVRKESIRRLSLGLSKFFVSMANSRPWCDPENHWRRRAMEFANRMHRPMSVSTGSVTEQQSRICSPDHQQPWIMSGQSYLEAKLLTP